MKMIRIAFQIAFAFILSVALVLPSRVQASPIVHAGDTLNVDILNFEDLGSEPVSAVRDLQTANIIVAADGTISLPVAGSIQVAGKTAEQISKVISRRLAIFVRDPSVSVRLVQQGSQIFLTGATVGVLTFIPGETLATALGQLRETLQKDLTPVLTVADKNGGTLARSSIDFRKIALRRDGKIIATVDGEHILRFGLSGPVLAPSDTLLLANKPIRVDVRGQVGAPGAIYLYPEDTLEQALLNSGGPLATASTVSASLIRKGVESPLPLAGTSIRQSPQDGDQIIVRAAPHVTVIGQVEAPGEQILKNGSTLLTALYDAGGPSRWGNVTYIEVIHDGIMAHYDLRNMQHGDLSSNMPLNDGDIVYVPEGHKIDGRLVFSSLLGTLGAATGIYDLGHL